MKNYYVVFDMSPLDEADKGYLQVGLGPITAADFKPMYKYNKKYDEYLIKKEIAEEAGLPIEPWVEEEPISYEEGGGGSFFIIIIILAIIGGMAFGFYKYRQSQ